jgi:hypothetical protein
MRRIEGTTLVRGQERYRVSTDGSNQVELVEPSFIERMIKMEDDAGKADTRVSAEQTSELDGFEKTLTPMLAKRAVTALTTKGINSDKFYPCIRDLIRDHIDKGWRMNGHGNFEAPNGVYLDGSKLTKLGCDYAEYLTNR